MQPLGETEKSQVRRIMPSISRILVSREGKPKKGGESGRFVLQTRTPTMGWGGGHKQWQAKKDEWGKKQKKGFAQDMRRDPKS